METVRVTAVNHAIKTIKAAPDVVWREIQAKFLTGIDFEPRGYVVTQIEPNPNAPFGGYSVTLSDADGNLVDERIALVSEIDQENRRLSLYVEYKVPAESAFTVHASYQALQNGEFSDYKIDSYARSTVPLPAENATSDIQNQISAFQESSDAFLETFLSGEKQRIEALDAE